MEYDIVIIGGGPAGLSAAIYASRAAKTTALYEGDVIGGVCSGIELLQNYPGFSGKGVELARTMKAQAESFNTVFIAKNVIGVNPSSDGFDIFTQEDSCHAKAVILATGVKRTTPKMFEGYLGKGVSACAVCDGFFYRGLNTAVYGSGLTAVSDALYLAPICNSVNLICPKDKLYAEADDIAALEKSANVKVHYNSSVMRLNGDTLKSIDVFKLKSRETVTIDVDGLFLALGHQSGDIGNVLRNDKGEIITNNGETSVTGIFAAGDCTDAPLKQVVTAAAQGALAATKAVDYLNKLSPNTTT